MIDIHVIDVNDDIKKNNRFMYCLSETLKHQTNYKLHIWTKDAPEVKGIYLRYKTEPLGLIFDVIKLTLMTKYSGFYIETDHIIYEDLSKIPINDYDLIITPYETPTYIGLGLHTWSPIYINSKSKKVQDIIKTCLVSANLYAWNSFTYNRSRSYMYELFQLFHVVAKTQLDILFSDSHNIGDYTLYYLDYVKPYYYNMAHAQSALSRKGGEFPENYNYTPELWQAITYSVIDKIGSSNIKDILEYAKSIDRPGLISYVESLKCKKIKIPHFNIGKYVKNK